MPAPLIRPAEASDTPRLAELGRRTFVETFLDGFAVPYPAEDLAAFMAQAYAPALFAARIADPAHAVWVAEREGVAVGYAVAGPCTLPHPEAAASHAELHRLYVRRDAQRLGLGGALMGVAMAWMQARGAGPLWLGVWSGNRRAQAFYAAYGFRRVGEYLFPVGRWRDEEFIYRRG